jgi:hypothetical protein
LTKRLHILVVITAVLLAPSLILAGGYHKMGPGQAQMKENVLEVPLWITNQDNLAAIDIPLQFSEGVTLKEVKFQKRVDYFDLKVANIDNENRTVVIGLLPQMTPQPKPDLEAGEGPIAKLVFEVNDASVTEIQLEPIELKNPHHSLMFVYHEFDANNRPNLRVEYPEFEGFSQKIDENEGGPSTFGLSQNYPNPFNPTTTILFSLAEPSDYSLTIYNITGQVVDRMTGHAEAGEHSETWNAERFGSGVYFYRLEADGKTETKKMVLLK